MIAREIAIFILIFAGVAGMINSLGIFDFVISTTEYTVDTSEIQGITQVSSSEELLDEKGLWDKIGSAASDGITFGIKLFTVLWNFILIVIDLGGYFQTYIPNQVGTELRVLIDAVVWTIVGITFVQIKQKWNSRGVE